MYSASWAVCQGGAVFVAHRSMNLRAACMEFSGSVSFVGLSLLGPTLAMMSAMGRSSGAQGGYEPSSKSIAGKSADKLAMHSSRVTLSSGMMCPNLCWSYESSSSSCVSSAGRCCVLSGISTTMSTGCFWRLDVTLSLAPLPIQAGSRPRIADPLHPRLLSCIPRSLGRHGMKSSSKNSLNSASMRHLSSSSYAHDSLWHLVD